MIDFFNCGTVYLDIPVATYWYKESMKHKSFYDMKQDFILLDNDFPFDVNLLPHGPGSGVQWQVMRGFSRPGLLEAYKKAKLLIDWTLPGYEWGNLEATLMDVPVIFGKQAVVRSTVDFPFSPSLHAETYAELDPLVLRAIHNYTDLVIQFRKFKQHAYEMRLKFYPRLKKFFSDNVHLYVMAYTLEQIENIPNFLATAIAAYGFASIEVLVPRDPGPDFPMAFNSLYYYHGQSYTVRVIPEEYRGYGEKALYVVPPIRKRKYTMFMNITTVLLGTDITQVYSEWHTQNRKRIPFVNREVSLLFGFNNC